ncbi:MAG: hypothetical protein JXA07_04605 [Spirochaetes bacterium]|nr:hypothetical protein [Spirochaetota bacterium]
MAISAMRKIVIAGAETERDEFIRQLQNEALLHPVDISRYRPSRADILDHPSPRDPDRISRLKEAKVFLEAFHPRESFARKLFNPGHMISQRDFDATVRSFNPAALLEATTRLRETVSRLEKERESALEENARIGPWRMHHVNPDDLGLSGQAGLFLGTAAVRRLSALDENADADYQVLATSGNTALVILAVYAGGSADGAKTTIGFRETDLPSIRAYLDDRYRENEMRVKKIDAQTDALATEARKLLDDFDSLMVLLEHFDNLERRTEVLDNWIAMKHSFVIGGWLRQEDTARLDELLSRFETVTYEEMPITDEDSPPIALKNPGLFSPFQLITRLYNYPSYRTLDPSPLVSVFFALFFGIALTDAGYGLFLSIVAIVGITRIKGNRDIFLIMLWGGIFTIIMGLLTGGIFGDLFRSQDPFVNAPILAALRDRLTWFDPMREPMVFFRFVLLLGVVHVLTGLIAGLIAGIRRGDIADALVDNAAWIVISLALLAMLFSTDLCVSMSLVSSPEPPLDSCVFRPAAAALAIAGSAVILFGARGEKSFFFRFFLGFLRLFVLSGVFSYLGDVLSYIRLMALGMVTAGIAMAVNAIAFMMYDIPVAGFFLTVCVLVGGHLFNCAINMLGGFVHTLRLQYVEFFPKFFVGGGRGFMPLANGGRYVKIID